MQSACGLQALKLPLVSITSILYNQSDQFLDSFKAVRLTRGAARYLVSPIVKYDMSTVTGSKAEDASLL